MPGFPLWGIVAITAAIATAYIFFGGLGAGLSAEGFELVIGAEFSSTLYAVIFGVGGWMAVQLVREGGSSSAAS